MQIWWQAIICVGLGDCCSIAEHDCNDEFGIAEACDMSLQVLLIFTGFV